LKSLVKKGWKVIGIEGNHALSNTFLCEAE